MAKKAKEPKAPAEKRPRRKTPQTPADEIAPPAEPRVRIVGIGASAGGLEAIEQFFTHMPSESGMAFVILQHLNPARQSSTPEILSRLTRMSIHVATDGMKVEPNSIYLNPPNRSMGIANGALYLEEPVTPSRLKLPVDFFFRSLAKEKGSEAICIILSGTGTDSILGLRAIKEKMGTVLVQDPESARYDGMPRSAIGAGLADFVLKPEQMPEKLVQFVQHSAINGAKISNMVEEAQEPLQQMFAILRTRTGHDFSAYKQASIRRRLQRRMSVNQINDVSRYVRFLKENEDEAKALLRDLLINVTNFFRDPEAFEALKARLKESIQSKAPGSDLRVWVAGCATGEESYSVAMIISECLSELEKHLQVQIYGTDIDIDALNVARTGMYPASIAADITPERLRRFFVKEKNTYRIRKEIREMVTFAPQDLIKGPPFFRMDLVCCRNLLIYLESDVQKRLLPLMHYALNPGGTLFLGSSETVGDSTDLFSILDKKWKIYRRLETVVSAERLRFPSALAPALCGSTSRPMPQLAEARIHEIGEKIFLDNYAPTFAVIDEKHRLVYIRGRTEKYMEIASGKPSLNILDTAREGLRADLSSAIYQAISEQRAIIRERVRVKYNGSLQMVNLTVAPFAAHGMPPGFLLVVFQEGGRATEGARISPVAKSRRRIAELEGDLKFTRENLHFTIEDLEAANEELKSANEELLSNNEELQSTNEELDTSREELQSLNEELSTLNTEIQDRNEQLATANDDLKNFLNRTDIAIIFLDDGLNIRSFTPATSDVFNLRAVDEGRPLEHITSRLAYDKVVNDARKVLRTLRPKEMEVQRKDGCWYKMRILPYFTTQNVVSGLVMSFLNIDEEKKAAEGWRQTTDYLDNLFNYASAPIIVWDPELKITRFNHAFERLTGLSADEVLGHELGILFPGESRDTYMDHVRRATVSERWEAVEINIRHVDGSVRTLLWNSATLLAADGKTPVATIAQGIDITERKQLEMETKRLQRESAESLAEFQTVLDATPVAVWIAHDTECRAITGNICANQLFGVQPGDNISPSALPGEAAIAYRVFRNGAELKPEELPAHVAAATGKPVAPQEHEFIFEDGHRLYMLFGAAPLVDVHGHTR
ncbi:MAG: chemotaxis protein CheB, partial [Dehalococcoidia bacterium]|nr:chemotaxis protein CheB [Dehalococcoidia bacterium]